MMHGPADPFQPADDGPGRQRLAAEPIGQAAAG
jgi:hypothetical protein